MPRGTLRRLANQQNLLTDLTIYAESEQERFTDVQVITLAQYQHELALECALQDTKICSSDASDLDNRVNFLLKTEYAFAKEFVSVETNSIRIGVDFEEINDAAVDYALSLLMTLETFTPGHRSYFGNRVQTNATPPQP